MSDISIGDIISQFKDPEEDPQDYGLTEAEKWFRDFQAWLIGPYEGVVHDDRDPGLHASALGGVCARRNLLINIFGAVDRPHTSGNYFTFDVGHALHGWWQERYLGPKQELYGDWVCLACPCPECGPLIASLGDISREEKKKIYRECGKCRKTGRKVTRGLMPMECGCGVPWQLAVRYLELKVENEELDYVGHTDGVLVHKPKRRIFEFKTMSPSEYDKLVKRAHPYENGPKPMHVIQAHAYMAPLGLEEALIIYQNKGSQCKWSITMDGQFQAGDPKLGRFVVQFDQRLWDSVTARIHEHHRSIKVINSFKEKGKRLPRAEVSQFARICETKKCDLAARCPVARECFTLD